MSRRRIAAPLTRRAGRVLLALAGALAVGLGIGAPAASASVEYYSFDDIPATTPPGPGSTDAYQSRGLLFDTGCGYYRIGGYGPQPFGPHSGSQAMVVGGVNACNTPAVYLGFQHAPRTIAFFLRSASSPRTINIKNYDDIDVRLTLTPGKYTPFLVTMDSAKSTIFEVSSPTAGEFVLDDIATSDEPPSAAPPAVVDAAPAATTTSTTVSIPFHDADVLPTFTCALDGAAAAPCTSPFTRDGLAIGPHTLQIRATGVFGLEQTTPTTVGWTVAPVAPDCVNGPDADHDGVSDACDTIGLPGTTPPVSGETTNVKVESGVVFIKLPDAGTRSALVRGARLADPATPPGFVPLKGDVTVPVGATVDASAGTISVTSATAAAVTGQPAPTASARLSAAIFQIRQARAKRAARPRKGRKLPPNPTDLVLRSPSGGTAAATACAANGTAVLRSISAVVPKGSFQLIGAAATVSTTTKAANVRAVDRCDGTYVEVGRGVAQVTNLHGKRRRTVTVRSGRAYLVKGDFLAIEGRKGL